MTRDRFHRILTLSLPIIGGMMSQNILNLVDTAMVGVLGPNALAAVGVASFASFLAASAIMGLSSGVQAMTARRVGEGKTDETAVPLNGGLFLAAVIGVPIAVTMYLLAPSFYPLLNSDPAVIADGVPYFQARVLAVIAVGMNFSFRGYWTGVSLTKLYLRTLLIMHACNVVLNYLLIYGKFGFPELGATGAGIGTAISTYLGTAIYLVLAWRIARPNGFFHRVPRRETMMTMLRLSIPSAIQQFLFAAGMTAFFWIIGQVGTAETAAANVMINLLLVAILPGMGLGLAAMTLVSEALGRGDPDDARRWSYDVLKVACVALAILGLPAIFAPDLLLSGFIHDPEVRAIAHGPLRLVGIVMALEAAGIIFLNALLGAGAARAVMTTSVATQWLIGLPAIWLAGPYLGLGLMGMWLMFFGYRIIQTVILGALWSQGGWETIKV